MTIAMTVRLAGVVTLVGAVLYALADVLLLAHNVGPRIEIPTTAVDFHASKRWKRRANLLTCSSKLPWRRLVWGGLLEWAQHTLGRNWSDEARVLHDHELVTSGPYRWVRHPIYSAFLLILGSPLLLSANWLVGGLWIAMTGLDITSRMTIKESLMMEQFGERYRVYQRRTGRLLPQVQSTRRKDDGAFS